MLPSHFQTASKPPDSLRKTAASDLQAAILLAQLCLNHIQTTSKLPDSIRKAAFKPPLSHPPGHQILCAKAIPTPLSRPPPRHLHTTTFSSQSCFLIISKPPPNHLQTTRMCSQSCSQTTSKPPGSMRKIAFKSPPSKPPDSVRTTVPRPLSNQQSLFAKLFSNNLQTTRFYSQNCCH